jgi:hypothetical protein
MRSSLTKNMRMAGRTICGCFGIALMVCGALFVKGAIGAVLVLLSAPLLLIAIIGFYQAYGPFGTPARWDNPSWGPGEIKKNDENVVSAGIEVLWLLPRGEPSERGNEPRNK